MGRKKGPKSEQSLVCFIQALQGMVVAVELRSDLIIKGLLDSCDNDMNLFMKDATTEDVMGAKQKHDALYVRGGSVRFVHVPASVDPVKAVEDRRDRLAHAEALYSKQKGVVQQERQPKT